MKLNFEERIQKKLLHRVYLLVLHYYLAVCMQILKSQNLTKHLLEIEQKFGKQFSVEFKQIETYEFSSTNLLTKKNATFFNQNPKVLHVKQN